MRIAAPLLSLLLASGCRDHVADAVLSRRPAPPQSKSAPARAPAEVPYPRLSPGTPAIVMGSWGGSAMVRDPLGRPWRKGQPEYVDGLLDKGDRLMVLEDKAGAEDSVTRDVEVRVVAGKYAGNNYLLDRRDVLPIGAPR